MILNVNTVADKKTASPVKKGKTVQKVCFIYMFGMNMMLLQYNELVGIM